MTEGLELEAPVGAKALGAPAPHVLTGNPLPGPFSMPSRNTKVIAA